MRHPDVRELDDAPGAVTVVDRQGVIVRMNPEAARYYAKSGGAALVGTNVLDCHPEPARSRVAAMLGTPYHNTYTTEKNGKRYFVTHTAWYADGEPAGIVEAIVDVSEETAPSGTDAGASQPNLSMENDNA